MYIKFIIRTGLLILALLSFAVLCACGKPDTTKKSALVISTKPHTAESDVNTVSPEEVTKNKDSFLYGSDTYIILNNDNTVIKGEGAVFENSVLTISQGGTYRLSGELSDGQIYVDSSDEKENVRLYLNGVSVSCKDDASLYVGSSPKGTVIYLCDDTVNSLSDVADKSQDEKSKQSTGVIYSENELTVDGEGVLNIRAEYGKGVFAKKNVNINEGYVHIAATLDNGIYCEDSINMTDGTVVVYGSADIKKEAVSYAGSFSLSDGKILALGNVGSLQSMTGTDDVRVLTYSYSEPVKGLNVITEEDGEVVVGFEAYDGLKNMFFAGEELDSDESYTLCKAGKIIGEEFNKVYFEGEYTDGVPVGVLS